MAATLTLWSQLASPVMRPPNIAPHVMDVIESAHYLQYSSQNVYTEPNHGEMRQNLDWGILQTPPGFPGGSDGKESACNAEDWGSTWVQSLGQEDPLEKGMATHCSLLGWRIPWTEEPGGLQSIGLQSLT